MNIGLFIPAITANRNVSILTDACKYLCTEAIFRVLIASCEFMLTCKCH